MTDEIRTIAREIYQRTRIGRGGEGDDMTDVMQQAKDAINKVFSDKSVSQGETRDRLAELREEIEMLMDTLPEDDEV